MTKGFIIPLALAAAVIAMPSGCITSEDGPTVIIGEDGMTVLLNGKSVPNPATIEALGEGYSFDNPTLYYNGEVSAGVIFYEGSEQDEDQSCLGISFDENDNVSRIGVLINR